MNDFSNLNYEYDSISTQFKSEVKTFDFLSSYYQSIYTAGKDFHLALNKACNERIEGENDFKINKNGDMWLRIEGIFDLEKKSVELFGDWLNFLDESIISSINKYRSNLSELYYDCLSTFKKLSKEVNNQRTKVEKLKMIYIDENDELNLLENEKISTDKKREMAIEKKKSQASLAEKDYKNEIDTSNKLYEEFEFEYNQLFYKNKEIHASNLLFLRDIFSKHSEQYTKLASSITMPNIFDSYSETSDMNLYTEDFTFITEKTRIDNEKFSNYDDYRSQNKIETKHTSSSSPSSLTAFDNYKNIISSFAYSTGEEFFSSFERNAFNFYTKPLIVYNDPSIQNQDSSINSFLIQLFKSKIQSETLNSFKEHQNDVAFITLLLDEYLKTYTKTSFCIQSMENFTIFAGLLMKMINSLDLTKTKSFELLTKILFISEWSYCGDIFLCSILGKFNFFKIKISWITMIEYRLLQRIQTRVNELREVKKKEENTAPKGLFDKFTNIFSNSSDSDEEEEGYSLITEFGYNTRLKNYSKLPKPQKETLNNEFISLVHITLKEYITNLCNFNFDLSEGIEIIVEIAMKYSLPSDKVNLYLTLFNIASRTIRRGSVNDRNPSEIEEKIKNIKNKNITLILLKYPSSPSTDLEKALMLQEINRFIDKKNKVSLFLLNKTVSKKIKFNYYKEMLLNSSREVTNANRLNIWKAVLHSNAISSKIDYEKSIKQACTKETKETSIIELDVARTAFPENADKNREMTIRILKCLIYLKPEIRYYQGMNYIGAFMLRLTQNERESFNLLYGLFTSTDIGLLFSHDLHKLKAFYLIFDKLLLLDLPTIYYYFKEHSVNTNYYVTPWLVTLFTNILQFMKEKKDIPIVVLNIWDEFILKGWKALMESILALIYYHKDDIQEKKEDDLFGFLINDLVKSNCFNDENYDKWIEIKKKIHISSKIIRNIEEEIEIEHLLE